MRDRTYYYAATVVLWTLVRAADLREARNEAQRRIGRMLELRPATAAEVARYERRAPRIDIRGGRW